MEFRILGPLEVVDAGGPLPLPRGRGRALLAFLVLHAGQVVSTERLIDELWGGEPTPTAVTKLHGLVSALRKRLEPGRGRGDDAGLLQTRSPGYLLAVDPEQVDANRFRRLLDEARDAPPERKAALLHEALELWRGPALAEFTYEPFAQTEITVLHELRLTAVEERFDADLSLGRHADLVGKLEGLAAEHPYRERLRGQLMLALYRSGRQADALRAYQDGRRTLVEDLGIEPGPALAGLEQAILRQDPSMDAPQATPTTAEPEGAVKAWLPPGRRTVTVVFVDLIESVGTGDTADPEVVRRLVARCFEDVRRVVDRHGGTVQGLIGGVVVAAFGIPTAHEDDALRGLRAAVDVRASAAAVREPDLDVGLAVRIGVNSGEVVLGEPATGLSGDVVTMAARLQQAAKDEEVLVGETTRRLVGDAVRVEPVPTLVLDRHGRPATVWRLVDLAPGVPVRAVADDRPLVGRTGEVGRLREAFQRVVREGRAHRFTVIGDAGVGKSRLALEFAATLGARARVLTGRCPAYGEGITFWPLREVVLQAAGDREGIAALLTGVADTEPTAAQIAGAIGLSDDDVAGRELFPAARRLFEALASRRPVVVVVDDAHWAQPTFLDLVDYLAGSVSAPVLFVCLARPELALQDDAASLVLEPLSPEDGERLVHARLHGRVVADELVTRIVETAQGNPLFLEQLLAASRDDQELPIPPTVQALLAARLDRLGPAERDLLRCASVVGMDFSVQALTALLPDQARRFLDRHLRALEAKELVRPADGDGAFVFRHVLVQLAAYRSLTSEVRSELHERCANWLEGKGAVELDELVGYHLEQAHEQRRRLGIVDEPTHRLAVRAGERLAKAGVRALTRYDLAAAGNLLSRARPLLPLDHPARPQAMRRLVAVCPALGWLPEADEVLVELLEDARRRGDARQEQHISLERLRISMVAGPDPTPLDAIHDGAERALKAFAGWDDQVGMSEACYVLAAVHLRAGRMRGLEETARRGLAHARRSGDVREQMGAPWFVLFGLLAGPTPVPAAIRGCQEVQWVRGFEHPGALYVQAVLFAMLGEFDQARQLAASARRVVVEQLRVRRSLASVARRSAAVEAMAGELAVAERELRTAVEIYLDVGDRGEASEAAAELSLLLSARGNVADAAGFAALAREQAPAESVTAQALSRAATARTVTTDESARLLREAVELVPRDMLNLQADLHVEFAETLTAIGQPDAGLDAVREATDLYERKGNLVGARRSQALTAKLADTS